MTENFRIEFFGTQGGFPTESQMVSFYIQANETKLLLEVGSSTIFAHPEIIGGLDAVLVSHMHSDHRLMLPHLVLARMAAAGSDHDPSQCPFYAPEDIQPYIQRAGIPKFLYTSSAQIPQQIKDIDIEFIVTDHPVLTYAYKLTNNRTKAQLTYTADTSLTPEIIEFAAGSQVLICECALSPADAPNAKKMGHMTPSDAAELINQAQPEHAIITHYTYLSPEETVRQVKELADAPDKIIQSHDGLVFSI